MWSDDNMILRNYIIMTMNENSIIMICEIIM